MVGNIPYARLLGLAGPLGDVAYPKGLMAWGIDREASVHC